MADFTEEDAQEIEDPEIKVTEAAEKVCFITGSFVSSSDTAFMGYRKLYSAPVVSESMCAVYYFWPCVFLVSSSPVNSSLLPKIYIY